MRDDAESTPALICAVCLKDLSKAMHFRNKAIRAEKYFKGSDDWQNRGFGDQFEPEIRIKLEEDEEMEKIKSEPIDEDPNYEYMTRIDAMISNPAATTVERSFDVFASKPRKDFRDYEHHFERRKKSKHSDRFALEDFGSSSGVVRCKLCMKSFTSVNSHQNHMKTVHREMDESEMHKCKYCNRYFKLKIYLNRHVSRIHGCRSGKGRSDSKKKSETIFNKEDVSLYCEVSFNLRNKNSY